MRQLSCFLLLFIVAFAQAQTVVPEPPVSRVVVIGDVHGDYKNFVSLLRDANILDKRENWISGEDTLVQMGDLTDRGPDSLKVIRLLQKLDTQAREQGGLVEVLIGNHEAMNMMGDLRYVHAGEYKALRDSDSKQRRRDYYAKVKESEQNAAAEQGQTIKFDRKHRKAFEQKFPLGYVEHRLAWAPGGELGDWAIQQDVVLKLHGNLYVHGGLSADYADQRLADINTRIRSDLIDPNVLQRESTLDDPDGPLWYRGWAAMPETPENEAALDTILKRHGVQRMIIAHTPIVPTVLPRFNGKILMVDVGLAEHYGGGNGVLELINNQAFVRHGKRLLAVPSQNEGTIDYLEAVADIAAGKARVLRYREILLERLAQQQEQDKSAKQ